MPSDDIVSVVIPAYNVENSLAITIDSVLSQTYNNTEIMIIDDGSTVITKKSLKDMETRYYF